MEYDPKNKKGEFSARQLSLLARGLKWYREAFRKDSRPRSWVKIAEDILTWDTAIEFFPELSDADSASSESSGKKVDSGWPITGQTLERWVVGISSTRGKRRHTRPEHRKLEAIAAFLIAKRFVLEDQLVARVDDPALPLALLPWTSNQRLYAEFLEDFSPVTTVQVLNSYVLIHEILLQSAEADSAVRVCHTAMRYHRNSFGDEIEALERWQSKRPYRRTTYHGVSAAISDGVSLQFLQPDNGKYEDAYCALLCQKFSFRKQEINMNNGEFMLAKLDASDRIVDHLRHYTGEVGLTSFFFRAPEKVGRGAKSGRTRKATTSLEIQSMATSPIERFERNLLLIEAARFGDLESARRLLELGADPNFLHQTPQGSALHYAASNCCWEIVELLLASPDVEPLQLDSGGAYPSDLAIGDPKLADRLANFEISFALASSQPYRGHLLRRR